MARIISFMALVVILVIIGALFLRVMAGFLLPLFLALLLVVIFRPLYDWFGRRCGRHSRIAAVLTTASILALVLVPMLFLLAEAGREAQSIYHQAMKSAELGACVPSDADDTKGPPPAASPAAKGPADGKSAPTDVATLVDRGTDELVTLSRRVGMPMDREDIKANLDKAAREFVAPLALRTTQFLGQALIGLLVMVLGVYYFFADGPVMVQTLLRLTPMENRRTQELIDQFDSVTRTVVVATLSSAFVQGLLLGAGFYVAGIGSVFLLTALAMLMTLVPFVGAAILWVPVCLWQLAVEGNTKTALILAAYCLAATLTIDNVIKPLVLHGRSNLHPLLALLSVLGGVQALGPIGILVGPMVVAFLQTLLNMVHTELNNITKPSAEPPGPARVTLPM